MTCGDLPTIRGLAVWLSGSLENVPRLKVYSCFISSIPEGSLELRRADTQTPTR